MVWPTGVRRGAVANVGTMGLKATAMLRVPETCRGWPRTERSPMHHGVTNLVR